VVALAVSFALTGCSSVPFDYPKTTSRYQQALPESDLGRLHRDWRKRQGENSGFVGLPNGIEALGARLRLMEAAEHTIDAQYFILKQDRAGALFADKMLEAADRGVRVRFLVDDIFTPDADAALTLLDRHPNIEIRLFNPVSRRGLKWGNYLADFKRANRRMHNKSFTVDNTVSIVGGRNIGEEYFELNQDVKFDDYEVLTIGPVVDEVSAGFDEFWNSGLSVPMEAFGLKVDPAKLDEWRAYIADYKNKEEGNIYRQAVNSTLIRDVEEGRIQPAIAPSLMITDSPEKLTAEVGTENGMKLANEIGRRFNAATTEVVIVTPYFIPGESGATIIENILAKGVRVAIITNSLASTNHVPVHSAYARYRKRLLEAGAEFYEIRADNVGETNEWGHKPEFITLHSKGTIVDRDTVFIGSLNFDPRSIVINSEMGLFIESAQVGGEFYQAVWEGLPATSYRVDLDDDGKLRWTYENGGTTEVHSKEPGASWGRRFMVKFYGILPIEDRLLVTA